MNGPCKNPNCHSCGQPHPNCRCYAAGGMVPADDLPEAGASGEVPESDLPVAASGEVPADDLPSETDYSSTGQTIMAGFEGAAQGIAGPLAPLAERWAGVSSEDIAGRAQAHPIVHGVSEAGAIAGSLLTGVGEAALIAKGAGAVAKAAELGKVGSAILRGAIEGAAFSGSDEVSKAMLGKPGSDPSQPVSHALLHIGAAGLMGAVTGGIFSFGQGMIGKGLQSLKNQKVAEGVSNYLTKVGESGDPLGKLGVRDKINKSISKSAAGAVAAKVGAVTGNPAIGILTYEALEQRLLPVIEKITDRPIGKANKYVAQAFLKGAMENQAAGVPNAIHYATQVGQAVKKTTEAMEALFQGGSSQLAPEVSDAAHEELKRFIEDGQVDQQVKNQISEDGGPPAFAKGGMVKEKSQPAEGFSAIFPEQSALLTAAKSRIAGYLNGLRPNQNSQRLPFDSKNPDTDAHRLYNNAIGIAVNPLKVLDKVNKGNLTPQDMKHFVSMYPEVHSMLSQKMTDRITKAQLAEKKPPYAKRQSMSLFLGTALDSTMTPVAIQTAQAVFAPKGAPPQAPTKNRKGTSSLAKVDDSYRTADQARAVRQQKQ